MAGAPCLGYVALDRLPAVRWATRVELYRMLVCGRAYLGKHFRDGARLSDAARAACMSPYHFNRMFRLLFGETPVAYATELRLLEARRLLSDSEAAVSEIALRVGFSQSSSLSKAFRERFGLSPSDFRLTL